MIISQKKVKKQHNKPYALVYKAGKVESFYYYTAHHAVRIP